MNRKEELEFGKQMDASPDKKEVADLVIKYNRKNVLDLGAGTGIISKLIAEAGIKCVAVDNNFKTEDIKSTENLVYVPTDLVTFVENQVQLFEYSLTNEPKYDCIILSAVLHELNKKEFNYLKKNIYKIMTDDCVIIIREPYYKKEGYLYKPFKSLEEQERTVEEIINVTDADFLKLFYSTKKISNRHVPLAISVLNAAFTYSYGEDSWEREVNEYRFTFSYDDLIKFFSAAYKYNHYILTETKFDKSYKKYFKKCGYSDDVLNSIDYTNCTLVAKPGSMSDCEIKY